MKTIEHELDTLGLSLTSTIDQLLKKLGLKPTVNDVDQLPDGLVGDVDGVLNQVDNIVKSLLTDLGLGDLDTTIVDLEKALGLSRHNTIKQLLKSLGIL